MYYPKSQITPNLYTNGGEFVSAINQEAYSGYYFKISNGKYFTGRNQDDRPNVELVPIEANLPSPNNSTQIQTNYVATVNVFESNNEQYLNITHQNPTSIIVPTYNSTPPTQQDYQVGEFRRYFCKKTNEYQYIEINQEQFDKLLAKDPQILWQLYQPFFIDWQLTGDKQKVAQVNKNATELVIFRNKFFGLNEYLKLDFLKYYQPEVGTTTSGSYINGVNQGYVLDNRDRRGNGVFYSQNDSGSVRRDSSITR